MVVVQVVMVVIVGLTNLVVVLRLFTTWRRGRVDEVRGGEGAGGRAGTAQLLHLQCSAVK